MINSCATITEGATPASPFDMERCLGQWYEIARLDFRFEHNLNNTTANYSVNDDGTIKVLNRGYNYVKEEWDEATGKAKFAGEENAAGLKVSFFGPFYAPYNVIAPDRDCKYALVAGKNMDYLWMLARDKTIPGDIKEQYLKIAADLGYNISDFIRVEHN